MDIIYLEQLEIETIIGVYDRERTNGQKIYIDLEMATDISTAGTSDHLKDALDYHAIAKRITECVEASHFQLIEALAEHIANLLLEEYKITWLKLKLAKPGAIENAYSAGIIIERGEQHAR